MVRHERGMSAMVMSGRKYAVAVGGVNVPHSSGGPACHTACIIYQRERGSEPVNAASRRMQQ